jgi:uncharacterized protein YneF (UPF0154 family)
MSAAHLLYIPVSVLVGIAVGYVLGARAARQEAERMQKRARK